MTDCDRPGEVRRCVYASLAPTPKGMHRHIFVSPERYLQFSFLHTTETI